MTSRKTLAMKATDMQVRLDGCGAVLADPSGQDYYVVNYGDNAWSQLLAQRTALQDPARLTNLKLEAKLLVGAGLADASRQTSIDSVGPAPAAQLRMLRRDTAGLAPLGVERRLPRLQGPAKPRPSVR